MVSCVTIRLLCFTGLQYNAGAGSGAALLPCGSTRVSREAFKLLLFKKASSASKIDSTSIDIVPFALSSVEQQAAPLLNYSILCVCCGSFIPSRAIGGRIYILRLASRHVGRQTTT